MSALSILAEECELLNDSKYRTYITQVEKALKSFEYTSEWADLISALGKLNKVLLGHVKYPVIPKRVTIGKRLAQCLHPALPGGVHLKALETYDIIFKCIGTQRLAQDLFIYSAGLFPLLGYAAMNVKPVLLMIYERHFVGLGKHIKPGLNGLLLGLLPGLEEGSEFYDKTNLLLEDFCEGTDPAYFYTCLWECVHSCPSVRLSAITFLLTHFNKKQSMEDQLHMIGLNINLMVDSVCSALQDTSVLVQRSLLDFLLAAFPIHNGQLVHSDMAKIVKSAVNVLLRRDMSLNRRLYAWLLGTSTSHVPRPSSLEISSLSKGTFSSLGSEPESSYFEVYSKDLLVQALKQKLTKKSKIESTKGGKSTILKTFRIVISLLDKPEIGPMILESVLLSIFRGLYREYENHKSVQNSMQMSRKNKAEAAELENSFSELLKTANLMFGTFEPYYIWDFIARMFELSCASAGSTPKRECLSRQSSNVSRSSSVYEVMDVPSIEELCKLVSYLLDIMALETFTETQIEHLPAMLHRVINSLTSNCEVIGVTEVSTLLRLCKKILSKVEPSMAKVGTEQNVGGDEVEKSGDKIVVSTNAVEKVKRSSTCKTDQTSTVQPSETGTSIANGEVFDSAHSGSDKATVAMETEHSIAKDPTCEETQSDSAGSTQPPPLTYMELCINSFQAFFHAILVDKFLQDPEMSGKCIDSMTLAPENYISSDKDSVLDIASDCSYGDHFYGDSQQEGGQMKINVAELDETLLDMFNLTCKLLVDFASFPMFCTDLHSFLENTVSKDESTMLPNWLQDLISCCCFVDDFRIQCPSLSTILDLAILTQSVQAENKSDSVQDRRMRTRSYSEGTISVVMRPILHPKHLQYIDERTEFYKLAAVTLWHFLEETTPSYHQMSVKLFNTLHQVAPSSWICEDVIGRGLVSDNEIERLESYKKFTILWHLTRNVKTEVIPGRPLRTFDRSMFVMLDSLKDEVGAIKVVATTWLTHVVQHGDISRIIEPLLLMLLHPDTARVSIQHVDIHKPRKVRLSESGNDEDSTEANIYAISSVGGNVIYHVNTKGREFPKAAKDGLKSYTLAVMGNQGSGATVAPVKSVSHQELHFDKVNPSDLNLRINPFGSENSLDKLIFDGFEFPLSYQQLNLTKTKRLDKETCAKEGISFTGHDDGSEHMEQMSEDISQQSDRNGRVTENDSEFEAETKTGTRKVNEMKDVQGNEIRTSNDNGTENESGNVNGGGSESEVLNQNGLNEIKNETETDADAELTAEEMVHDILDEVMSSLFSQEETASGKETNKEQTDNQNQSSKVQEGQPSESVGVSNIGGHRSRRKPSQNMYRTESVNSSNVGDNDLLNAVNKHGSGIDSPTGSEIDLMLYQENASREEGENSTDIHTLHMHLLLYTQKYDYQRTLYALSSLKSMLVTCPRLVVTALVTTSISAMRNPQLAKLQLLLARHRKSVFGKNFFGEIPPEVMSNYRSNMFLEIFISVCLYFVRGYYPNLMMSKLSEEELLGNKEVHILAVETLTLLMSEVISIMRDSGKSFVSYISDLLQRCKLQKALLHCILATIYNSRKRTESEVPSKITEAIISFNEDNLMPLANETFQIKLLNFLLVIIMLEEHIHKFKGEIDVTTQGTNEWDRLKINYQPSLMNVRYIAGHAIVQQGMFLSAVLSALKQFHMCHMHRHWMALVTASLPYMGKALPGVVISIVSQLCRNLEAIASEYEGEGKKSPAGLEKVPPDHAVTVLNALMALCHYCLLDNVSKVSIGQPAASSTVITMETASSGNILTNLLHVFNPTGSNREASPQRELGSVPPVMEARTRLLSSLPRIIACMTCLWKAMQVTEGRGENPTLTMGTPKVIRQYILEFLSPLSLSHGTHLLGAVAVAWNDRRKKTAIKTAKVVPVPCDDQLLLVDLVSAIKVLPMDTLIQTVKQVLRQPPPSELAKGGKRAVPLEVNMLQFFFAYVQQSSTTQLLDSWTSLLTLLREALQLMLVPQGQFLLLLILNEFVQKTPPMDDKKNQKEVQEISQRLLEAVAAIAGSSLEQTTWLRRNYAVKPGPQDELAEPDDGTLTEEESPVKQRQVVAPDINANIDSKYSVQALALLAELTAPLLDVIYSSEEKDRVAPFLTTILYNVFPYLRNHNGHNLPSLRACSQLLSTISSYQYTRKAWRKEALELLLDGNFFQMDVRCIGFWHTVVDNLMTHDKVTFKDLIARVSMTQGSSSLALFSNKEQEYDQKAQMLKRLAFVIFCSEHDQYQKSIPDIQERLAESLRLPQIPSIMAHVFLCFRVLLMRISPQHLTSMWPTIITEMIHVFLQMEQELSTETEEFVTQLQRIAALDSSWAHLGNGLNAHNNPSWLQLYLSVCKLLDLCLALPADNVPQFQLYRWAFIGGAAAGEPEEEEEEEKKKSRTNRPSFTPHIIRLSKLLNAKLQGEVPVIKLTPGRPLLTFNYLRSLAELQPFFNTLCLASQTDNIHVATRQVSGKSSKQGSQSGSRKASSTNQSSRAMPKSKSTPSFGAVQGGGLDLHLELQPKTDRQFIEELLERDFLEAMA